MADNSGIFRDYHLADSDLALFANSLVDIMTRDIVELGTYSITITKITELADLCDDFQDIPNDETLRANLGYAVELRESNRNAVLNTMRSIAVRAKAIYGENSAKYRALSPGNISQLNDGLLLSAAKQVHDNAVVYATELAPEGINTLYLTDFNSAIDAYENAIDGVANKKTERDIGTESKILKGNELYALIVKYCDYGKAVWDGVSPARFNDYIIYVGTSPGSLTAPTDLYFSFPSRTFSWSEVENATSYQLEWSIDGDEANYVEIYSGSDTSFTYNDIASPLNYLRVRARNANGFGLYSDVLEQGYFVTLPPPVNLAVELLIGTTGTLKLTFDAVPSANVYKIYRSTTNVGDVAGSFVYAGQSDVNSFIESLQHGHRYYYRCTAENPYQTSTNSGEVYIEL